MTLEEGFQQFGNDLNKLQVRTPAVFNILEILMAI